MIKAILNGGCMKIYLYRSLTVLILFILTLSGSLLFAQESPFVPEKLAVYLNNEISGDRGYEYIRWQSHYHRPSGSKGFMEVAKLFYDWAKKFELENVQIVDQKYTGTNWDAISGELWLVEPDEVKITSYAEVAVSIPNNCPSAHQTVELVDIGKLRAGVKDIRSFVHRTGKIRCQPFFVNVIHRHFSVSFILWLTVSI